MKELLKELGFEHLPMLSEFVEAFRKLDDVGKAPKNDIIFQYSTFITQPLTKGMFIPCDEEGNIIDRPRSYGYFESYCVGKLKPEDISQDWYNKCHGYQQAQERVLFESDSDIVRAFERGKENPKLALDYLRGTIEKAINSGVKLILK